MKFRPLRELSRGLRHYTPHNDKRHRSPGFFLKKTFREDFTGIFFWGKSGNFFSARKKSRRKCFEYAHKIDRIFRGAVICSGFGDGYEGGGAGGVSPLIKSGPIPCPDW
jgi:hypothetical protein